MDREHGGEQGIRAHDVHVWYAWTDVCDSAPARAYYLSLLSEEETARINRFAFDHLRFEYLLTRALCRTTLSVYADVPPQAWRFVAGRHGRPALAETFSELRLDFNLTNCSSLVACVIARDVEVGIDAERICAFEDTEAIAQQSLSARETAMMRTIPVARHQERLCELWTLKESYLKALGTGLSVQPTLCGFDFENGEIRASFDRTLADDPSRWQFRLSAPNPEHRLAIAVRHGGDLRLHMHCAVPGPPSQG